MTWKLAWADQVRDPPLHRNHRKFLFEPALLRCYFTVVRRKGTKIGKKNQFSSEDISKTVLFYYVVRSLLWLRRFPRVTRARNTEQTLNSVEIRCLGKFRGRKKQKINCIARIDIRNNKKLPGKEHTPAISIKFRGKKGIFMALAMRPSDLCSHRTHKIPGIQNIATHHRTSICFRRSAAAGTARWDSREGSPIPPPRRLWWWAYPKRIPRRSAAGTALGPSPSTSVGNHCGKTITNR